MADQYLRIFLEDRGDGEERRLLAHIGEGFEAVRHDHVDATREQQLADIEARPALAQVTLNAVLPVDAGGDGLVVAAMLGLGAPVGMKGKPVERLRTRPACERQERRRCEAERQC